MNDVLIRISELANLKGITLTSLCRQLGISPNSFTVWKKRDSVPSGDTLGKFADYFGVTVDYLLLGEEEGFYTDRATAEYAQAILDKPELKVLFDAAKDVPKEVLESVVKLLEASKK